LGMPKISPTLTLRAVHPKLAIIGDGQSVERKHISPLLPHSSRLSVRMKYSLAVLSTVLALAAAAVPEISVDSAKGQGLLSKARRVEEEEYDWETQMAWITGYSLKFQGCHSVKQWNGDADEDEDVKISTKRLVRFRLCPSDTCSASKAAGCSADYGDYIIDMDTFMSSYFEGRADEIEYNCQWQLLNKCDCQDSDDKGDDFNADYCEYDCFNDAGMSECIDRNPYQEEDEANVFELEEYMECKEIEPANNDERRRRKLEEEEEVKYYVGPYCSSQGGSIKLGMFTDDSCTEFASSDIDFKTLMGFDLPYSGENANLIDMECIGCIEKQDPEEEWNNANGDDQNNNNQNGDEQDADNVIEMCETIYTYAGKCEANLPIDSTYGYTANNNACTYMEGIRIIREDGIVDTGSNRTSGTANAFIVIFAMGFAGMAFYVFYLRTSLGVKKNTLL
jgi:hypothetical protein